MPRFKVAITAYGDIVIEAPDMYVADDLAREMTLADMSKANRYMLDADNGEFPPEI